ncbi:hypothetical protein BU24DRAFT_487127 [Aaosphaeria arxii CBS 175.79]|uniref:Uncharacterized protein n=1 Tax=Aaosphaeria arxii CBS 175.79 TaxID=1450172 RepID=A0A6A5Y663_9PLEO|nr:uncharacterized protein BU24DRAFT_487127 [Aaosphaeria arxii CBS 175.79]KAF2020527.1 hypothetical protein BU24DRAFT_487127 [Aaosphaeria arxii CBS 175.79]
MDNNASKEEPSSQLEVPRSTSTRTPSPTQYEFVSLTGTEDPRTTRRKLKKVRSHVMKNYLHQQRQHSQDRSSEDPISASVGSDRRKGKEMMRARESTGRKSRSPGLDGKSASWKDSLVGYGIRDYFDLGNSDASPFSFEFTFPADQVSACAQSYMDALLRDQKTGLAQPTFDTLRCRSKVVSIVKETLDRCGDDFSESLVLAVNILAFGCALDNEWNEARGHMDALLKMVSRRGVENFTLEVRRAVTWTTYSLSIPLSLPPVWPPTLYPDAEALPLAFLDEAQLRSWKTMKRFPKDSPFIFDVVIRLHQLNLATSSDWHGKLDSKTLSNLYFETMYAALAVEADERWIEFHATHSGDYGTVTMMKVWALGAPGFIWATLRHAKVRLGSSAPSCDFEPVYARLKDLLEGVDESSAWPRGKNLEVVLATLFYSLEACGPANSWRTWLIGAVRRGVEGLRIKDVDAFKKILRAFPCSDEHMAAADRIWGELYSGEIATAAAFV